MNDITLPEVAALQQRARFFKDGNADKVEISAVGSKDTYIKKVSPDEMARFKPEWDAYCDGKPLSRRPGTALTDCPGLDQSKADGYVARNIHTLEELAVLSDSQCQAVGHGTLTDRKNAQALLTERKMRQDIAQRDAVGRAAASVGAAPAPVTSDVAEIKDSIKALTDAVTALVALSAAKKPGRPKKEKPDAAG